jgi:glycosyltransferase involved in cell wall biosynthesis
VSERHNAFPLVSIIVPAYNYAGFVTEAINSTLIQSHNNIEVIVVDDGSVDDTASIVNALAKTDARICYIYQNNQGLSSARNTGMKKARGEFLVFLDADDVLHPQKIQAHLEHFLQMPETDISYGRSRYFLSGKPEETFANIDLDNTEWMSGVSGGAAAVMPLLVVNNIMPVCSAMLRRSVLERVGDFDTTLKSLEDWDYWLRATTIDCIFSFSADERLAAFIRVHDVSMSQNTLRMLITQYVLRKRVIPGSLEKLVNKQLRHDMLEINTKHKILNLIDIASQTGIANWQFIKLCYGDSFKSVKKAVTRYLKRKSSGKIST